MRPPPGATATTDLRMAPVRGVAAEDTATGMEGEEAPARTGRLATAAMIGAHMAQVQVLAAAAVGQTGISRCDLFAWLAGLSLLVQSFCLQCSSCHHVTVLAQALCGIERNPS